ncbi:unnamed protein product [Parnassius mnemosyne]|uniref:Uncharacterized protein n=1 Tax=Parnassius mnemosyne TaxID=213953 RepID=A0AAV1L454_9NEOP
MEESQNKPVEKYDVLSQNIDNNVNKKCNEHTLNFSNEGDQNLEVVVSEIPTSGGKPEQLKPTGRKEYTLVYNIAPGILQKFPGLNQGEEQDTSAPFIYEPGGRNAFVKFVLSLVLLMLLVTAAFLAVVLLIPDVKEFFSVYGWVLMIPALIILLGVNYAMVCSMCARQPPCNYVCLVITVIGMSIIAAKVTSHYSTEIVLYAVITTTVVVLVCFFLAFSRFDFTSWMLYVVVIATAFSVLSMIVLMTMLFTGTVMKPVIIIILVIGTLIEVITLTIELQTVIGGKSVQLSEDDYALGAYMIYTSIITIFLKLVQLIGLIEDM